VTDSPFRALVLGSSAGGGLPQWNCGCANCNAARASGSKIRPQTQSSLAVSVDGLNWTVLNASPDMRTQLAQNPVMHPISLRGSPIRNVVLTNGDIDHIAGLLVLRERHAFTIFATPHIAALLRENSVFCVLDPELVIVREVELASPFELQPGLTAELVAVPGKEPLYKEAGLVQTDIEGENTVGVRLEAESREIWYIPGCAGMPAPLAERLAGADLIFFDGTVFDDDEMITSGTGLKTGRRMGHMPMNGPNGSIAAFADIDVRRKVYIHINNTNPVWDACSPQRHAVEQAGWEIAMDGAEFRP
jgi:pyrroloquinoline quinone biosynthesis protein B